MGSTPPPPCPIDSVEKLRVSPLVGNLMRDLWRKQYHRAATNPQAQAWREGHEKLYTDIVCVNTRIKWHVSVEDFGHFWSACVWGEDTSGGYWESKLPDEFTSVDTAKYAAVALARICNHSIASGGVT